MEYAMATDYLPKLKIIGRMKYPQGWHRSTRCRFNIVFFMACGEFLFEFDTGEAVNLSDGETLVIPSGTAYRVYAVRDCEYAYVHFALQTPIAQNAVPSECEGMVLPRKMNFSENCDGMDRLVRHIARCEKEFSSGGRYSSVRADVELMSLLTFAATEYANMGAMPLPHTLSRLCAYVNANIGERVTLSTMAEYSGLSKQYVMRLFKKHLGVTVTDYVNGRKLSRAKDFLRETDMTVDEISYRLGFCGSHYFCRLFKKYFGLTPTEYQKKTSNFGEL